METENYVLDIMGEPADNFADAAYAGTIQPLDPKTNFGEACRSCRCWNRRSSPWRPSTSSHGASRSPAISAATRRSGSGSGCKGRYRALLADYEPVVSRVRSPLGRRGIYAVRIGVDDRANADIICQQLRGAGGACIVVRNR